MKVALIYSFQESDWFSCTVINRNLIKAYTELFGKENLVHINYTRKRHVSFEDLKKLESEKVEKLIFIDHKPTPINFLEKLKQSNGGEIDDRYEFIIHVFGDYPLYLTEWRSVNELLENKNVKYICASYKQKKYIEKYMKQSDIIFVSPFPVDKTEFYFDSTKRDEIRKELKINEKEKLFIYTGRLSYQKRIKELVEIFLKSISNGNISKDNKLILIGSYDLLGLQYLSYTQIHGEYFRDIEKVLSQYEEYRDHVIFYGQVENNKLKDLYNAADYYISFSTYHDEDYGMSVAESLCTGLPALLTNWAGYFSFQIPKRKEFCPLIPVQLGKFKPEFDEETASQKLAAITNFEYDRKEVSDLYHDNFSVEACAQKLNKILETKVPNFTGPTDIMIQITNEQFIKGNEIFRLETNREFNSFYFKVYDAYAE